MATRTSSPPRSQGKGSRSGSSGSQTRRTSSTRASKSRSSGSRSRSASANRRGPGPRGSGAARPGSRAARLLARGRPPARRDRAAHRVDRPRARSRTPPGRTGPVIGRPGDRRQRGRVVALPGSVGNAIRAIVEGAVGIAAYAVPLFLLLGAWRMMRRPGLNGPAGRAIIGWAAISLGVLGLIHIKHGLPRPGGGQEAMRQAGGAIGYIGSAMIADLFRSTLIAIPLLVLLAFFGILVVTGNPGLPDPRASRGAARQGARPAHPRVADGRRRSRSAAVPVAEPLNRGRRRSRTATMTTPADPAGGPGDAGLEGRELSRRQPRAADAVPRGRPRPRPRPRSGRGRGPRAAAAHAAPAAGRAAEPVRRHQLHAARQRGAEGRQRAQGHLGGVRRRGRAGSPRCSTSSRSTRRSPATRADRP